MQRHPARLTDCVDFVTKSNRQRFRDVSCCAGHLHIDIEHAVKRWIFEANA